MIQERSWVEINLDNFKDNLRELKKYLFPGQAFLQIVKADAYGHGAFEIAKAAIDEGAVYLGVANAEEGKLLRIQGIKSPILILSPSLIAEIPSICDYNLVPTLSDLAFADALSTYVVSNNLEIKVHVKVDTGMNRSGFRTEVFNKAYKHISKLPNIIIEGLFSHFAASENDANFTVAQSKIFDSIVSSLKSLPRYIHLANSAAVLTHNSWKANLVRYGIMSYGVYTDSEQYSKINLKSVMTFKSIIAQIKDIKKGEYVGYNRTWKADKDGQYGIIPIGYADGYDYLLSNKGLASIKGQIYKTIGKVSMDMITVDLASNDIVKVGDEVVLMGGGTNLLRAEQLTSKYCGSAYELLCQVGRRAKRYYLENNQIISYAPLSRREFVSSDFDDTKLSSIISSAINQRLQDDEIADLIFREVLRGFFYNKDKDIQYRKEFVHKVKFIDDPKNKEYYITKTNLKFKKRLQNDYFIVACANSEDVLKRYFMRRDVEYRWLMDTNFKLTTDQFSVTMVKINNVVLNTELSYNKGCLEFRCTHPNLKQLVGKEVSFSIETETFYPKSSHQLSIFITELTKGVMVRFIFPKSIHNVESITVFSGKNKFPEVEKKPSAVLVKTLDNEWVFPNSGIIFAY